MLADNNSPFFAVIAHLFFTVKAFPLKDIFRCSHCPIPITAWPSADLHLNKAHSSTCHLWNVHSMHLLKSTDCYDFTGCEIITNLEQLPSSHCPFKLLLIFLIATSCSLAWPDPTPFFFCVGARISPSPHKTR